MVEVADARIDDWRDPVFPSDIVELRRSLEPMAEQIRLEPEPLLAEATAATGLRDLGDADDPGYRERLDLLLRCLREEAQPDAWAR